MRSYKLLSMLLVLALLGCGKPALGPHVLELKLGADSISELSRTSIDPLEEPTLISIIDSLEESEQDDEVKGYFLELKPFDGAMARADQLANIFASSKKPVHCHFQNLDNVGMAFAATACDKLEMSPAGNLNLVGVALQVVYLKSALDAIGAKADILHAGQYKGTGDSLIRDTMPPSTKETLGEVLDDLDQHLKNAVAKRSGIDPSRADAIIDQGPFDAADAKSLDLIDAIAFRDAAKQRVMNIAKVSTAVMAKPFKEKEPSLTELLTLFAGNEEDGLLREDHVAVVYVAGSIVDGADNAPGNVAADYYVSQLRKLRDSKAVKAVLLRIDSPGGSALASDRIWHAVWELRKKKTVYASVGEMAASGGYYIASAAEKVFAHQSSLVGSIGVVGGKVSFRETLSKLKVNPITLKRGKHADSFSLTRSFTESETDTFRRHISRTYDRFLRRILRARDMKRDELHRWAQGRIMTGKAAHQRKLVDELGGYSLALRELKKVAGLPKEMKTHRYSMQHGSLMALLGGSNTAAQSLLVKRLLDEPLISSAILTRATLALEMSRHPFRAYAAMPYSIEIR